MDKKTFLEELRKSLRVLKEEELQDIIGEYEQHIDMKVQKGLTVEQAIADFGNVKELAAEILEAYHVRAEFDLSKEWEEGTPTDQAQNITQDPEKDGEKGKTVDAARDSSGTNLVRTGVVWFRNGFNKIGLRIRMVCVWLWGGCCWCGKQIMRPFQWMKSRYFTWKEKRNIKKEEKVGMTSENIQEVAPESKEDRNGSTKASDPQTELIHVSIPGKQKQAVVHTNGWIKLTLRGMKHMIVRLWNFVVRMTVWCVRMCWNCFVVGTTLFIGSLGLMCLFASGVLGVLLMQGYPLAGLTVGCAGLVLSFLAAAALVWTLMWRKEKGGPTSEAMEETIAKSSSEIAVMSDTEVMEMEEGQHA